MVKGESCVGEQKVIEFESQIIGALLLHGPAYLPTADSAVTFLPLPKDLSLQSAGERHNGQNLGGNLYLAARYRYYRCRRRDGQITGATDMRIAAQVWGPSECKIGVR